ncbi:nitroreductase [Ferroglobus placidus DSM 10642]|uniref:Nitroreductase n=1 Tax=Ferroglobus placidus (strain DSM 10642 / AEDII12DO) TaxID=589924 RepID=D3RWV4_FERPA|nr:nitroreductase family protein [Ferroglobus placidus]ADC64967.1 nitroreductase [Ferroglobus placidus DSM 10642]
MSCVAELAKRRKSVRKFKPDNFDMEVIIECIDVAKEAPSGSNAQPWHFVIVKDEELKRKVREVCERGEKKFYSHVRGELAEWLKSKGLNWEKPFLTEAPYIVGVFAKKKAPYSRESVWIAVAYFLLALEERGLASLTYTPPNREEVAEVLRCPPEYRLEVLIPVGFSADSKEKEPRKSVEEITSVDYFDVPLKM